MENKEKSVFEELYYIDCSNKVEEKNGLKYLSWAWAWAEVKKRYPDANYTIYETTNPQGYVCNYFTDGRTCWVKTGVTINGLEHIEELPVMDYKNKSIPLEQVTSFDVNKTIQRSVTKALGRFGIGLFLYAGEDLPEEPKNPMTEEQKKIIDSLDDAKKQVIIKTYKTLELTSEQASNVIASLKKKGLI